jgi:hypothetical protein
MEDDLNFYLQMEDDLNIVENVTTSFFQMEDNINVSENGRQFQNLANGKRLQYFDK